MKFLIIITSFLLGHSTFHSSSNEHTYSYDLETTSSIENISEYQWMQYQNYRKIQYGDQDSSNSLDEGQFYFIDSELLKQINSLNSALISHNGDSVFLWRTKAKSLTFNEWTVLPDHYEMPLGLVKVRWVSENNNYDKFISIVTQDFTCRPLKESNTCFMVDLMIDTPRKFVQRKYFDRFTSWDISLIENGRYRLVLKWQNGHLLSPVFNIQHNSAINRSHVGRFE